MNRKLILGGAAVLLTAGLSTAAFAQSKPDTLVKQRQAAMILQGKYFGPLAGMAQGKVPFDAKAAARNAALLEALSHMAWDGFDPATKNEKSAALPAVFTDTAKFKQAADRFQTEADKLNSVAKAGDEAAIKAQIGAVGKTCSGCHESFREKR
jgi:cytochrome c556